MPNIQFCGNIEQKRAPHKSWSRVSERASKQTKANGKRKTKRIAQHKTMMLISGVCVSCFFFALNSSGSHFYSSHFMFISIREIFSHCLYNSILFYHFFSCSVSFPQYMGAIFGGIISLQKCGILVHIAATRMPAMQDLP